MKKSQLKKIIKECVTEILLEQLTQQQLDDATDLGTVYPSQGSWDAFNVQRKKLAAERNNGEVGKVIRVSTNNRGKEAFFAPDINAKWVENFS